jgi:hypothetical protein
MSAVTVQPEIKRLHSPDVFDLCSYVPDDPDSFGLLLQVLVGPAGAEGEESFNVMVCTPRWFDAHLEATDIRSGRHHLFVKRYDHAALLRYVTDFVAQCNGTPWEEVALRISRLGMWEFEDYRE